MSKSPAFQLYVQDFLLGTSHMTAEQVGGYIRLLCHQWDKGFLPDDHKTLRKLSGVSPKNLTGILSKFEKKPEGLINQRLQKEKLKRDRFIEKQINNGKNGGRPKTQAFAKDNPSQSPSISSSLSSSISSSNNPSDCIDRGSGANAASPVDRKSSDQEKKIRKPKEVFIPPLHEEVRAYMGMRGLTGAELDKQTQLFMNHYTNSDWKMKGGKKIKSWELTANSWMLRIKDFTPAINGRYEKQDDPTRSLAGLGGAISQYLRSDKPN